MDRISAVSIAAAFVVAAGCHSGPDPIADTDWVREGHKCATEKYREYATSVQPGRREATRGKKRHAIAACLLDAADDAEVSAGWRQQMLSVGCEPNADIYWRDMLEIAQQTGMAELHLTLLVAQAVASAGSDEAKSKANDLLRKYGGIGGSRTVIERVAVAAEGLQAEPEAIAVDLVAGAVGRFASRGIRGVAATRRVHPLLLDLGTNTTNMAVKDAVFNSWYGRADSMLEPKYAMNVFIKSIPLSKRMGASSGVARAFAQRTIGTGYQGDLSDAALEYVIKQGTGSVPQSPLHKPDLSRQRLPLSAMDMRGSAPGTAPDSPRALMLDPFVAKSLDEGESGRPPFDASLEVEMLASTRIAPNYAPQPLASDVLPPWVWVEPVDRLVAPFPTE